MDGYDPGIIWLHAIQELVPQLASTAPFRAGKILGCTYYFVLACFLPSRSYFLQPASLTTAWVSFGNVSECESDMILILIAIITFIIIVNVIIISISIVIVIIVSTVIVIVIIGIISTVINVGIIAIVIIIGIISTVIGIVIIIGIISIVIVIRATGILNFTGKKSLLCNSEE